MRRFIALRSVPPAQLTEYIRILEHLCEEHRDSPELRTCLGMTHAINYDVYKSMEALEAAHRIDGEHFLTQLENAELQYRGRALEVAEEEAILRPHVQQTVFQNSPDSRWISPRISRSAGLTIPTSIGTLNRF
jgi:hypothetical protein